MGKVVVSCVYLLIAEGAADRSEVGASHLTCLQALSMTDGLPCGRGRLEHLVQFTSWIGR